MLKRKSHTKSRNGCTNCKKRRIKCDEKGPPCANCVARSWSADKCTYEALTRAPRMPDDRRNDRRPPYLPSPSPDPAASQAAVLSPSSWSSSPTGDRLLELELLHRWSTRTWTAFYAIPECQPYLLDYLPRKALRHSYLLNAIFASAAADLALSSSMSAFDEGRSATKYLRASLEYGNRASAEFRAQISELTPENIDLVAYFSSMSYVVNFVTPSVLSSHDTSETTLDRVLVLVDAVLASARIGIDKHQWLLNSPCPARVIATRYPVDLGLMERLDPSTKIAIGLLTSVCQRVQLSDGRTAGDVFTYKLAVGQTKYCFAEENAGRLQKYFTSVFPIAGDEFATHLRLREPMALFVLMYWGVLVHKATGREVGAWMVGDTGRQIVEEVSELLVVSNIAGVPGVSEGIAWTRNRADLPPLPGY
ncbi:hypothetical protein B0T16DRAFT_312402, partial [Cercophora newfieldiana]